MVVPAPLKSNLNIYIIYTLCDLFIHNVAVVHHSILFYFKKTHKCMTPEQRLSHNTNTNLPEMLLNSVHQNFSFQYKRLPKQIKSNYISQHKIGFEKTTTCWNASTM